MKEYQEIPTLVRQTLLVQTFNQGQTLRAERKASVFSGIEGAAIMEVHANIYMKNHQNVDIKRDVLEKKTACFSIKNSMDKHKVSLVIF